LASDNSHRKFENTCYFVLTSRDFLVGLQLPNEELIMLNNKDPESDILNKE